MAVFSITDKDIIIVGQQPWDVEIGSNCKNIALEFSKHNRVLYVNAPLDRITSIRHHKNPKVQKRLQVIRGNKEGLIQLKHNLWNLYPDCLVESINWLPAGLLFNTINKRNNKQFANSIKRALLDLGFKNYLLFNDNEILKCFYLKEFLKPELSIYYSRDYILATDYWKKHGEILEPLLIAKNDLCVANSTYLTQYCGRYNHNVFYVGQGCELDLFQKKVSNIPNDIQHISTPVIGYVGAIISNRLDISLLAHIAERRPDWTLVLVGPEDEEFKHNQLHQFKNVVFTGPKKSDELPAYIQAFDVCLNPQTINALTIGNYPRKVDEYLAMGKPVVATATATMQVFKDFVYLASDQFQYISLIEKAIKEDRQELRELRKSFAATHTWEKSVEAIYKAISTRAA